MEFTLLLVVLFLIAFSQRNSCQKVDITAFEYSRRVPNIKDKGLGHCVNKIEELFPGHYIQKSCTLGPKQGPIQYIPKELNDTRIFHVQSINDIFVCLGLCDGNAASLLGLLHGGDCLAVEIAGKLTFSPKTYIQAYIEYYRSGIELIRTDGYYPPALVHHFDGNFYLRDRSYGTMELVLLEMRYPKKSQIESLKHNRNRYQHMSGFVQHAIHGIGKPSSIKLIRLSTAKEDYKILRYKKHQINDVINMVQQFESDIYHTRYDIQKQHIKPHLRYGMYPYTYTHGAIGTTVKPTDSLNLMYSDSSNPSQCGKSSSRMSNDYLTWEEACVAEVKLNTALKRVKRLMKKCKKIKLEQCNSLPIVKKGLRKVKGDVHSQRSGWHNLNQSSKENVQNIARKAKTLMRSLGSVSKKIREAEKLRRPKKAERKQKKKAEKKPKH